MQLFIFLLTLLYSCHLNSYERNPYVPEEIWKEVEPFLMPQDHPIKAKLDKIFNQNKRITASKETLLSEGFIPTQVQGAVCLALRHLNFPDYIFKVFPDDKNTRVDWQSWVKRVKGAERIRKAIKKFKYDRFFKVPNKWIYPLPSEPSPTQLKLGGRKNFILVVDNMHPIPKERNWHLWRSTLDPKFLRRIMKIVIETGAGDAIRANNLPFCIDGKQAFLDTERTEVWPIDFHPMKEFLNKKMRKVLEKLIKKKGGEGSLIPKPN